MSTPTPVPPPSDTVNITVDGKAVQARKGDMIIRATDQHDVYVPRFCYHEKLPVAANCRMCLVEVEKAPKPLPACATPVAEGMIIHTRSPKAIAAQRAVMEFLLINHPLDCPICDQGGECELQDLAMGFGRDISRFNERKRVVKDKNLGPLVSTDMTRCIHCTRCVRFGQEIAGIQELGTTGRGENTEIGTYIERSVDHELSGNIIDLCPVGALNSKPFRFRARAWEMTQAPLVSPHDGVGSNLYGHVLRGKLMRVVPRQNDTINETWISDRDRFSYEGVYSADRLTAPMVKENGTWKTVDWQTALQVAAEKLKAAPAADTGWLAHPSSTLEELTLFARLARSLGSNSIDHRLRQTDFSNDAAEPVPSLGIDIASVDSLGALLVVGSHLRHEVPVLASRVRKAAVKAGAQVFFVNPARFDYLFPVAGYSEVTASGMVDELAGLLAAATDGAGATDSHRSWVTAFRSRERRAIWLGALAIRHPSYARIRSLAAELATALDATLGVLAEGANAVGAWLAGAVPMRGAAGISAAQGRATDAQLTGRQAGVVLLGTEPWADSAQEGAANALRQAGFVIALTPFASNEMKDVATVLLPIGTFAETSGTFVNLAGTWQSFAGAVTPVGESRPGWKVLRVLGNLLGLSGFEQQSSEVVRNELRALVPAEGLAAPAAAAVVAQAPVAHATVAMTPIYQIDPLVRRAGALQRTRTARGARGLV
ncbi:MAG: NADH-quinone oxidoreductase subunit NuoG [Steroidobacteraceae bacterium]